MTLIEKHFPGLNLSLITLDQQRDLLSALRHKEKGGIVDIHVYSNGFSGIDYKNEAGQFDRNPNQGPAVKAWYDNGILACEEYYTKDMLHRENAPSRKTWHRNGQRSDIIFCMDGLEHLHYMTGPAKRSWDEDGNLVCEVYSWKGVYHRDPKQGPAYSYPTTGSFHYFWKGQEVDSQFIPPSLRPQPDGLGRVFV